MICARTNGIAPTALAANTSHTPAASEALSPDATTMTAATDAIPIEPHSSGTRRRPRLRMSNHNSIATSGAATSAGTIHVQPAVDTATATITTITINSTRAIRNASLDRSSHRSWRMSTATSFSGVRTRNARNAATPSAAPAIDGAISRPSSTGSSVSPHPPCSLGMATDRHAGRVSGGASISSCTVPHSSIPDGTATAQSHLRHRPRSP